MQRKKPGVDVVRDLLDLTLEAYPDSTFIRSLSFQYEERGGLSKKQLDGLYKKAAKVKTMPVAKLATLEAMILKRPNRYKSELPGNTPLYTKDSKTGQLINDILARYPEHKRVVFFKTRFDNNETLSSSDLAELERFHKLLLKN